MELAEPILILSDLHLAHPATYLRNAEELAPLIRRVGAKTVVFNGDSVEMRLEHLRDQGEENAQALRRVCADHGAEATFICGNHDPTISDHHVLELADGQIIVTHGHVLFPQIVPWSREAKAAWEKHRAKLEKYGGVSSIHDPRISLEQRFRALQEACQAYESEKVERKPSPFSKVRMVVREMWPPTRPFTILRTWVVTPRLARRFAETHYPKARYVVTGHTHRAGCWTRHGITVFNLGSFTPLSGRLALVLQDDVVRALPVCERSSGTSEDCDRWMLGDPVFEDALSAKKPAPVREAS